MERRIAEFIAGLRAAGVRISLAESADAMRAIEQAGITDRELFKLAMRASLIKDAKDFETFHELFPLYFGKDAAMDIANREPRGLAVALHIPLPAAEEETNS